MGKKDARIDAYIADAQPFARPILKHLRKLVHEGCPEVEEGIRWGMPTFLYDGILCGMASFKAHCAFGFWDRSMDTGAGAKASEAMGQYGRITSLDDLPSDRTLVKHVREAVARKDAGIKPKPRARSTALKVLKVPADLTAALKRSARAGKAFAAMSQSHQNEYVEWIEEAKRDETRKKRLATTLEWLAEGKSRNWKYERK
ncbi:MAG: YdeI/OmpD-associated family protein [Candidatus Eiseniibacteriota bacterium]